MPICSVTLYRFGLFDSCTLSVKWGGGAITPFP